MMNDLTITQLCFEAVSGIKTPRWGLQLFQIDGVNYDPLHDDAQAMALVKRFRLFIASRHYRALLDEERLWDIEFNDGEKSIQTVNANLNRAICECVANMQQAKG